MQRTPIQRKTPLKAKTPLKRGPVQSRPKKKPAKKAKPKATDYKRWCDILFSQIVRARGVCAKCGSTQNLQCSHRVSRGYLTTRWDEDNADCMCLGCHHGQHMRPLENEVWLASIGVDLLALKHRALTHAKPDYPATLVRLVARAEELDLEIDLTKYKKVLDGNP